MWESSVIIAITLTATFVATVMTGPAGREWLANRRARRLELESPTARVLYLPSSACREDYARVEYVDPLDV